MERISGQLMNEFVSWFYNLVEQGTDLPKVFSGVNRDGRQFVVVLSDLPIGQGDHLDFMRAVLRVEDAVAYAFKMRVGLLNEKTNTTEERVDFFTGEPGQYLFLEIAPRDGVSWKSGFYETSKRQSDQPEWFMQDLFPTEYKPSDKDPQFLQIWGSVRDSVMWRQR